MCDGPMDAQTDGRTDRWTDKPSYRDTGEHLRIEMKKRHSTVTFERKK